MFHEACKLGHILAAVVACAQLCLIETSYSTFNNYTDNKQTTVKRIKLLTALWITEL